MSDNCCNTSVNSDIINIHTTSSGTVSISGSVSSCIIPILRTFINDLGEPPTYSDSRLNDIIFAAAFVVNGELASCSDVVPIPNLDLCSKSLSASLLDPNYSPYLLLVLMKSACIVDQSEMKNRVATDGIKAVCGPATLQVSSIASSLGILFERGNCDNYKNLFRNLTFNAPLKCAKGASQIISCLCRDVYNFSHGTCFTGCTTTTTTTSSSPSLTLSGTTLVHGSDTINLCPVAIGCVNSASGLSFSNPNLTLNFEDGSTSVVDLSDLAVSGTTVTLTLSGTSLVHGSEIINLCPTANLCVNSASGLSFDGTNLNLIFDDGTSDSVDLSSLSSSGGATLTLSGTSLVHGAQIINLCPTANQCVNAASGLSFDGSILTLTLDGGSTLTTDLSSLSSSGGSTLSLSGTSLVHGVEIINLCPTVDACANTASGLSFSGDNTLILTLDDGSTLTTDLSSLDTSGLPHLTLSGTTLIHGVDSVNLCPVAIGCVNSASGISFNISNNIFTLTLDDGTSFTADLSVLDNSGTSHLSLTLSGTSLLHGGDTVNLCPAVDQCANTASGLSFNDSNNVLTLTLDDGSTLTSDLSILDNSGTSHPLSINALSYIEPSGYFNATFTDGSTSIINFLDAVPSGLDFDTGTSLLTLSYTDRHGSNQLLTADLSTLEGSGGGTASLTLSGTSLVHGSDIINFCPTVKVCSKVIVNKKAQSSIVLNISDLNTFAIVTGSGTGETVTLPNISGIHADCFIDIYNNGNEIMTLVVSGNDTFIGSTVFLGNTKITAKITDDDEWLLINTGLIVSGVPILTLSGTSLLHGAETVNLCPAVDQCVNTSSGLSFNVSDNILTLTLDDGSTLTTDLSVLDNSGTSHLSLTLSGTSLLHGGDTVNLCPAVDQCVNTASGISFNTSTNIFTLTVDDGSVFTTDLSVLDNSGTSHLSLTLSGTSLLHGGDTVNLCPAVDQCVNTSSGLDFTNSTNTLTLTLDDGSVLTADLSALDTSGLPHLTLSGTTLQHGIDSINLCPVANGCVNSSSGLSLSGDNTLILTLDDGSTLTADLSSLSGSGGVTLTLSGTSLVHGSDIISLCSTVVNCAKSVVIKKPQSSIILNITDLNNFIIVTGSGSGEIVTLPNIDTPQADCFVDVYNDGDFNMTLVVSGNDTIIGSTIIVANTGFSAKITDDNEWLVIGTGLTISGVPTLTLSGTSLLHGSETVNLCPAVDQCVNTASGLDFTSSTNTLTLTLDDGSVLTTDLSALDTSGLPHLVLSGTTLQHGVDSVNLCPVAVGCVNSASGISFNTSSNIFTLTLDDGSTFTTDLSILDNSGTAHLSLTLSGTSLLHGGDTVNLCPAVDQCVNTASGIDFTSSNNTLTLTLDDGSVLTTDLSALDTSGLPHLTLSGTTLQHGVDSINLCPTANGCVNSASGLSLSGDNATLLLTLDDNTNLEADLSTLITATATFPPTFNDVGNVSGSMNFDWTTSDHQGVTLIGNWTPISPTAPATHRWLTLQVTQDAAGGNTLDLLSWNTNGTVASVDQSGGTTSIYHIWFNLDNSKYHF